MNEPTSEQAIEFIAKYGRRASLTVNKLGGLVPFITAMNSSVGRELLKDDVDRMDVLLEKVYQETANDQEKAEFRYLRDTRFPKVLDRLNNFIKLTQEIQTKTGGTRNG